MLTNHAIKLISEMTVSAKASTVGQEEQTFKKKYLGLMDMQKFHGEHIRLLKVIYPKIKLMDAAV